MFVLDFFVDAEDRVKPRIACSFQEDAILEFFPSHLACGLNVMTGEVTPKTAIDIVIEK